MKGKGRGRNLLLLVCLWSLPAVQVNGCPEACSRCSGHKHDQCEDCRPGWTLHDNTCVDVDECGSELDTCLPNSYCFNTEGSFGCRGCDVACVGCRGAGPAHCRKCAPGYRFTGSKCLDIDECSDRVLACPGLDEICINADGSFHCDCAEGFVRRDGVCVREKLPHLPEKGPFDDIKDDEVEVLKQMFFGMLLCALGTLAAKGDMVYTSVFIGAVAGMAGYWFSERGGHLMNRFLKEP